MDLRNSKTKFRSLLAGYLRRHFSMAPTDILSVIYIFFWNFRFSDKFHGDNIDLKSNDTIIATTGVGPRGQTAIVGDILSKKEFNKVMFQFTIHQVGETAHIGFIDYFSLPKQLHWTSTYRENFKFNQYNHCFVSYKGCHYIEAFQDQCNAINTHKISSNYTLRSHSKLIFAIDFVSNTCNAYLDRIHESKRLYTHQDEPTWSNLPCNIVPMYCYHSNSVYDAQSSEVSVSLLSALLV
eukprot:329430_1